jgi:hypothetical protein
MVPMFVFSVTVFIIFFFVSAFCAGVVGSDNGDSMVVVAVSNGCIADESIGVESFFKVTTKIITTANPINPIIENSNPFGFDGSIIID